MADPIQTVKAAGRLLSLITKGGKAGARANAKAGAAVSNAGQGALHDYYQNQIWHGAVEPLKDVTPDPFDRLFDATDMRQWLPEWMRQASDQLQPNDIGATFGGAYDPKGKYAPLIQGAVDIGNLGYNVAMGGPRLGPAMFAYGLAPRHINLDVDPANHSPLKFNLPITPLDNEVLTDTEREINQRINAHNKNVPQARRELDTALRTNEKQWDALHDYTRQRQDWILGLIKDLQKRGYTAGQIKTIVKKEKAKQSPVTPGDILRTGVYNQGMAGEPNFNLMQSPGFMSHRQNVYPGLSKNGVSGSYYYNLPAFYVP
jgi:hypothetical protein